MSDRRIEILPGKIGVLAENGPLHLVIRAYSGSGLDHEMAVAASHYAFTCLEGVAGELPLLRQQHRELQLTPKHKISRAMLESVRAVGDADLTPMAAVAGSIADEVANWLMEKGATRAIVDNGGDIAIRLSPGERMTVGLRPTIESQKITHVIRLNSNSTTWGVNTSGLGGRSLTRGIASAVTAFGSTSSLADAAATAIANACFSQHKNILQVPARQIDSNSDLGEMLVTVSVQGLPEQIVAKALENGLQKASLVQQQGLIQGALIVIGDQFAWTIGFREMVGEIESNE